ncbi:MAG: carboxymuconolactone decarboxylase family protein [Alphaproteobacteria bacterium]|nr:carboxymuconolactone decarboxylase family protein [Alphaproteobacteria bacterium]
MARKKTVSSKLPAGAGVLARRHPKVWASYAELGEQCGEAGPLDARTRRLVKIALAAGAALEGAMHSHVRRGIAEGLGVDEIRHIAVLSIPTLGLPAAVRATTWMDDILQQKSTRRKSSRKS